MIDPLALAVIDRSVGAYRRLLGLGAETMGMFYDNAHPDVRAWALATKAYMKANGIAERRATGVHSGVRVDAGIDEC